MYSTPCALNADNRSLKSGLIGAAPGKALERQLPNRAHARFGRGAVPDGSFGKWLPWAADAHEDLFHADIIAHGA